MALPSQTERQTEIGRSYVLNKKNAANGGAKLVVGVAAALILVAGTIWGVVSFVNRKSATGTLPSESADAPRPLASGAVKETIDPTNPATNPPTNSAAPGTAPASNPTTAPATTPTTSPTPIPTSTPATDPSGRPASVDVTRKDLTPTLTPAGTPGNTPGTTPGTTPPPGTNLSPGENKVNDPAAAPGNSVPQPGTLTPTGSTSEVMQLIQAGEQKAAAGDLVQARAILSKALLHTDAVREDRERIRQKLGPINQDLIFSPKINPADPMSEEYAIKAGDNLIRITRNRELAVDYRLIERINGLKDKPLRVGQKIKLVRGPFHAVVSKGDYRLDLFHGSPDDPQSWTYIRSFKVGLGTGNSTPLGNFVVRPRSKLVNPPWVNPQTGQKFGANDPKNPIGEYWLGLEGVGESKTITGYGIHGTIEPDSIGQQKSMGCVRLGDDDVKMIYELLVEQVSVVKIVP
ncbi:MAG TPA: L,D-transpeptidase family protein [Phycisphaerales bacterium]